jgi:branched-subunit amino acid transport protein AzlD
MQSIEKIAFVLILILATQLTRFMPLAFNGVIGRIVKNEDKKNILHEVLFFLLICYCFRDLSFTKEYYLRIFVSVYVFYVQLKFERTLLSIFSGTFIYMLGRYFIS